MAKIVTDHVGIVHLRVCVKRLRRKAVPVIPWFHLCNQRVLICLECINTLIVPDHLPHLCLAESKHHVEIRVKGERSCDVIAARHVIHSDRTYSHHENAVEHSLILLENAPVESLGVCHCMIYLFALDVEHHVCEIVVLIDDQVELSLHPLGIEVNDVQFADKSLLFENF